MPTTPINSTRGEQLAASQAMSDIKAGSNNRKTVQDIDGWYAQAKGAGQVTSYGQFSEQVAELAPQEGLSAVEQGELTAALTQAAQDAGGYTLPSLVAPSTSVQGLAPTTASDGTTLPGFPSSPTLTHVAYGPEYTSSNSQLWGAQGPQMSDVAQQGKEGDCYLESTMAALAKNDPSVIENAIKPTSTPNVYAVTLYPTGTSTPVTVHVNTSFPMNTDSDTPAGTAIPLDMQDNKRTLWPALIEKAYAIVDSNSRGKPPSYGTIDGGDPALALHTLTGQQGVTTDLSLASSSQTNAALALANQGVPTMAATQLGNATLGIDGRHVYTVLGTSDVNGVTMVSLRNPWGLNPQLTPNPGSDGEFQLTLSQFLASYASVTNASTSSQA